MVQEGSGVMISQDKEWRTNMEEKYQDFQGTRYIDLEDNEDIVDKPLMVDQIDSEEKGRSISSTQILCQETGNR